MVDLPPTMFGKSPPNLPNPLMNVSQQPGRTHENSRWVQDHQTFFSFNLRRFQSWLQAVLFSSWRFGQLQPFPKTPKPSFGGLGLGGLGSVSMNPVFFVKLSPQLALTQKFMSLILVPNKKTADTNWQKSWCCFLHRAGRNLLFVRVTELGKPRIRATGRLGFDDPTCHDRIWIPIIGYMWLVCLPTWMVDFHRCR